MGRFLRSADVVAILSLALVVLVLSAAGFGKAAASADRLLLASRIERGARVNESTVDREAERTFTAPDRPCDPFDAPLGKTIVLRFIARQNPALDFDGWARAVESGERLFRRYVACSPHDGSLWVMLATLERAIVVAPERIAPLVAFSERLSPSEIDSIKRRARLWSEPETRLASIERRAALRDLDNILKYARGDDAAALIAALGPAMGEDIARLVPDLPASRMDVLRRNRAFDPPAERRISRPLYQLPEAPPR